MVFVEIGANIRALRKQRGMTQEMLALESDMSQTNLREIELGRANPTVNTLLRLARTMNVSFNSIVFLKNSDVLHLETEYGWIYIPLDIANGIYLYGIDKVPDGTDSFSCCKLNCIAHCPFWQAIYKAIDTHHGNR